MKRRLEKGGLIAAFAVTAAVQIAVPAVLLVQREFILRRGAPVKFKINPIDPYDALRGRYVALAFDACRKPVKTTQDAAGWNGRFQYGQRVYAVLQVDASGFGKIVEVRRRRPKQGLYVEAKVRGSAGDGAVLVNFPFNRFYMDEHLAPRAGRLLRRRTVRAKFPAYVLVRVLGGRAVIENLYVGDRPIVAWIEAEDRATSTGRGKKAGRGVRTR